MITGPRLREVLVYDPKTGRFAWKTPPSNFVARRASAGKHQDGYVRIRIAGRSYAAHRLVWLYITNEWPTSEIDHKNGIRDDNRFENLRLATRIQNAGNSLQRRDATIKGYVRRGKKFVARITHGGKNRYLGWFDSEESAHSAYVQAAADLLGEFGGAR